MKSRLALVRATHLNDYISVLRDIGAPVDRDLARSKLPIHVEETPDLYVSLPLAIEWITQSSRDIEPMELGMMAAEKATLSSLRPAQQAALATAQTGLIRLEELVALSRSEDSVLEMSIRREGRNHRVFCAMSSLNSHPNICFAEWLNLQAIISVVRSVAGPNWLPKEMCFVSRSRPTKAVHEAFPETRILLGQPCTSIVIESMYLARSTGVENAPQSRQESASNSDEIQLDEAISWDFLLLLRKLLQPYLNETPPTVAFAAEMAGISTRTLQRRLMQNGSSYSRVLQEARFELARMRLDDPSLKIIEVAMTAGYESPQHFTRAFRRQAGFTPTEYRRGLSADAVF